MILIEKFSKSSCCWSNLIRDKQIKGLSAEEIVHGYRGFEGELICACTFEGNVEKFCECIDQCAELKRSGDCLLLHVISGLECTPLFFKKNAIFVGYDVGECSEHTCIYSSIFNEILFGGYSELVEFKNILNENFLFNDKMTAERYVVLHNQRSAEGKHVEDYMPMTIYEIWMHTT